MSTRVLCLIATISASACCVLASTAAESEATLLFNGKNLDGWYVYVPHKDKSISPLEDSGGVFKVEDGAIHVSGEEFGCLTTKQEYANYHLFVEFKWGTKRYAPRENAVRDSGILMHCVGPDKVWTKSIECQIQEGDCGDFWMVDGTTLEVDGKVEPRFKKKNKDAEKPSGEWNTVEVICNGDQITNIVNGVVVNKGTKASVTKGKIMLQSEGAEVFYRRVELRELESK